MIERYASSKAEKVEYEIGGRKYTVVRHFTGDKNIDRVVAEHAERRADREMGLPQ